VTGLAPLSRDGEPTRPRRSSAAAAGGHEDARGRDQAKRSAVKAPDYLQRFDVLRARFFDMSLDMMAVAGFDGYFKSVNPVWTDVLGLSEEELLSRPYVEFVHPDDREATAGASSSLVNGVQILSFENRYLAKDGSYHWLAWKAMPVVADSLVYATARDVTIEKEQRAQLEAAREALHRSEERTRLMLETIKDYVILTLDTAGHVTTWNAGGRAIKGYTSAEIIGQHFSRFYTDEDRQCGKPEHLLSAATAQGHVEDMGWRVRKDGSRFFADVVITALFTGSRQLRGFAIITRDVSRRHQAEEELAAANRELAQRTSDLVAIGEASRAIAASSTDPRHEICVAAGRITGASIVSLWEPAGGVLASTASAGLELPLERVAYDQPASGTARAFRTGERLFVANAGASALINQALVTASAAASAAFQPVLRAGIPTGVLSLAWAECMAEIPPRMSVALDLLAAETAVIIERAELRQLLVDEARSDGLTGIANRRAWDEEAPRFIERARRSGEPLSLAIVDLDHFKSYNDEHGHQAGDRLLRAVAQIWSGRLRGVDLLARMGGDEFMVLLANCDLNHATVICESLRPLPAEATCSVGVAEWRSGESLEALADRADAALYACKSDGRNRVGSVAMSRATVGRARRRRPSVT
jgi:diguanylate cyclase (GGDEF)-like protein/PAS domain S-box-containing protein